MSRQRDWQIKQRLLGRCVQCGTKAARITTKLGKEKILMWCGGCRKKNNDKNRQDYNPDKARKWYTDSKEARNAYNRNYYHRRKAYENACKFSLTSIQESI